jgi:hypothetical protein
VNTATKGRARELGSGMPRMSAWEREDWLDRAERAGWRPRETCDCDEPEPGGGGGNGFYLGRMCLRCSRRLRR